MHSPSSLSAAHIPTAFARPDQNLFFLDPFPHLHSSHYSPQSRCLEEIPVSDRPDLLQFMFGRSSSDGISVQGEAEEGVMGKRTLH